MEQGAVVRISYLHSMGRVVNLVMHRWVTAGGTLGPVTSDALLVISHDARRFLAACYDGYEYEARLPPASPWIAWEHGALQVPQVRYFEELQ